MALETAAAVQTPSLPTSPAAWFDERVRPAARLDGLAAGPWSPPELAATGARAAAIERLSESRYGATARIALTWLAGNLAGPLAGALLLGVARDGVLPTGGVEVRHHEEGWCVDVRLAESGGLAVAADHPWARVHGHAPPPWLEIAGDADELLERTMRQVEAWCGPVVDALAERSGRRTPGLWTQVCDAAAYAAPRLAGVEPHLGPHAAVERVSEALEAPSAPWRHPPALWVSEPAGDAPLIVIHRGGCCLSYRCTPASPPAVDRELAARFPGAGPRYCMTCRLRPPEDVEARTRFEAERATRQSA